MVFIQNTFCEMISRFFWRSLLTKALILQSSITKQDDFLVISSNSDFSYDSSDLRIHDGLTSNSVTKIKVTEEVSMIMPFTGLNLVTLFDLSQSNVEFIPAYMFQNCYNLEEVIPGSLTFTIYISAFENSAISKFNLENIRYIHNNAFFGCKNIKHVDIKNVTMFGSYCFSESGLIEFNFIQNVNEVPEGMLQHCVDLETVTLSPGIRYIENYAFYMCIKLQNVDSLVHILGIGNNAFEYTSLTSIANDEELKLEHNAFSNILTFQSANFKKVKMKSEVF